MRCTSCDRNLTDAESTRRVKSTGEFLDMCNKCYKDIADMVPTYNRDDIDEDYADMIEEENEYEEESEYNPYDEGAAEFIDKMNRKMQDEN